MKLNKQYLKKLLEAFEISEKSAIDLLDLQKAGFNYEEEENEDFVFHMQFLNDKGFVEREDKGLGFGFDKAADGAVMWSILPLRLTAHGHEYLKALTEQNKDDLLEVLSRRGCSQKNAVRLGDAINDLRQWDKDTYRNTAQALIDDDLIVSLRGDSVVFTIEGCRRAEKILSPSSTFTQNILNAKTVINSPIQQGGTNAKMDQTVNYSSNDLDNLRRLVDVFDKHIDELALDAMVKRKAMAQIATIKAQLDDEPDPVIVKRAGRTLRNITEGAIGSLIATAVQQPAVWVWVATIIKLFFS